MSASHTPGPWRAEPCGDGFVITYNDAGNWLATVWEDGDGNEEADARLIAAAPDLLAALKSAPVLSAYHGHQGLDLEGYIADYSTWVASKIAAIAKATGQ
jgi:hypothetical protein